jgi:hypothetical protein
MIISGVPIIGNIDQSEKKRSLSQQVEMVWKLMKFDIKILLCYMLHMMSHSVGFPYMKLMNVITNSDVTNL